MQMSLKNEFKLESKHNNLNLYFNRNDHGQFYMKYNIGKYLLDKLQDIFWAQWTQSDVSRQTLPRYVFNVVIYLFILFFIA